MYDTHTDIDHIPFLHIPLPSQVDLPRNPLALAPAVLFNVAFYEFFINVDPPPSAAILSLQL